MSTKTTFKRIALVAVAALGLGVLSTVPASAARTVAAGTNNITSISVSTDSAPVAGDLGSSSLHTITWTSDTTTSGLTINPSVFLKTMPLSGMASQTASTPKDSATAITDLANGTWTTFEATSITSTSPTGHDLVGVDIADQTWPSSSTAAEETELTTANAALRMTGKTYIHAHYAAAGTYVWTIWDDQNIDGIINGTEFSTDYTVVVGASSTASVAVATVSAYNASTVTKTATAGISGALVKLSLKDAAGNAVAPGVGASVTVSVNGSAVIAKVNDVAAGSGTSQSYQLGAGDFDGSGNAYINVTDTVAQGVTFTTTGNGWGTFTPASNLGLTFTAVTTGSGTAFANLATPVGLKTGGSAAAYTYNYLGSGITIATNSVLSTVTDNVNVEDSAGYLTGMAGADYDVLKAGAATTGGTLSFTMPAKTTSGVTALTLTINNVASTTISSATAAAYVVAVYSPTVAAQRAATATAISMTVRVKNEFGGVVNGILVTGTISGRNSTVAIPSVATNASGIATLSYTDASTSTSSLRDVATLTVASATTSATVTTDFTTDATLGVSTVLLTSNQTDADGADLSVITNWQINAGDGAQGTLQTVTATVKDASGVALAGVPVVFTVAGTGVAVPSNKVTIYTGSDGTAAGKVYAWLSGKFVVTATAGTKTDTINTAFAQEDGAAYVRTFTAVQTSDRVVTVTAKDRFGNLAMGASFTATLSGDNFFGTGTNVATGITGSDGTIKFNLGDNSSEVTLSIQAGASAIYGQTDALKGTVSTNDPLDVFTAATVGTAITAEVGVGASLDALGVNKLSVTLPASTSAATAISQAAADAAAEATDAANAATDAANAAAEAADAATAAAQDAADAVAALSTSVSAMISALKKQITALTNLVIKIQKKVKA